MSSTAICLSLQEDAMLSERMKASAKASREARGGEVALR
jgi:hypothetical protein